MTLEEFVNTYNGRSVGSGQCVALIKQYQLDVLGTSAPSVGNAKDYWLNYSTTPFLQETYTQETSPQVGDVVVWSGAVGGGYGHIAIIIGNISGSGFTSFDQNWNSPLHCRIENHDYSNVLGYLRPRNGPGPGPGPGPEPEDPTPTGPFYHRSFNNKWFWSTAPGYTGSLNNSIDIEKKQENAKYILDFLKSNNWTLESSSVVIGAMDLVSTLNSAYKPTTGPQSPFGLLGWRYWEFKDWVDYGTEWIYSPDYTIIDNSIGRLCWYRQYNLAWGSDTFTLQSFSESKETIENLSSIWVNNYLYNYLTYEELLERSKYWFKYFSKKPNLWALRGLNGKTINLM